MHEHLASGCACPTVSPSPRPLLSPTEPHSSCLLWGTGASLPVLSVADPAPSAVVPIGRVGSPRAAGSGPGDAKQPAPVGRALLGHAGQQAGVSSSAGAEPPNKEPRPPAPDAAVSAPALHPLPSPLPALLGRAVGQVAPSPGLSSLSSQFGGVERAQGQGSALPTPPASSCLKQHVQAVPYLVGSGICGASIPGGMGILQGRPALRPSCPSGP